MVASSDRYLFDYYRLGLVDRKIQSQNLADVCYNQALTEKGFKMAKINRVAIYDMDGTIVDSSHRYRTIIDQNGERIDLGYWQQNAHLAMEDKLLPLFKQYRADLADENCYVIIATARVMFDNDWEFVNEILFAPDYFISRKEGDTQSGTTLKINGLAKFFNLVNFKDADFVFYEDNVQYLKAVCDRFNIRGVYIPSVQGH